MKDCQKVRRVWFKWRISTESGQQGRRLGAPSSRWWSWARAVNWHREHDWRSWRHKRTELEWTPWPGWEYGAVKTVGWEGWENGSGCVLSECQQMARSADDSVGRVRSDGVWSEKRTSVFPNCCANAKFSHFNFAYGDVSVCGKLYHTQSRKTDIWIKFP